MDFHKNKYLQSFHLLDELFITAVYIAYCCRGFLLWFNNECEFAAKMYRWQREVNAQYSNIYLKYRNSCNGYNRKVLIGVLLFSVVLLCICDILPLIVTNLTSFYYAYLMSPIILCGLSVTLFILSRQVCYIFDVYDFAYELGKLFKSSGGLFILARCVLFLPLSMEWAVYWETTLIMCGVFCVFHYNGRWTLMKWEDYEHAIGISNNTRYGWKRGSFMTGVSYRASGFSTRANQSMVNGKTLRLSDVLNRKDGFCAFLDMMRSQQCLEVPLFIIEATQHKAIVHQSICRIAQRLYPGDLSVVGNELKIAEMAWDKEEDAHKAAEMEAYMLPMFRNVKSAETPVAEPEPLPIIPRLSAQAKSAPMGPLQVVTDVDVDYAAGHSPVPADHTPVSMSTPPDQMEEQDDERGVEEVSGERGGSDIYHASVAGHVDDTPTSVQLNPPKDLLAFSNLMFAAHAKPTMTLTELLAQEDDPIGDALHTDTDHIPGETPVATYKDSPIAVALSDGSKLEITASAHDTPATVTVAGEQSTIAGSTTAAAVSENIVPTINIPSNAINNSRMSKHLQFALQLNTTSSPAPPVINKPRAADIEHSKSFTNPLDILTLRPKLSMSRSHSGMDKVVPDPFDPDKILHIPHVPSDPRLGIMSSDKFAIYLFDKYLDNKANFCVNVSHECRKAIYGYFRGLRARVEFGEMGLNNTANAQISTNPNDINTSAMDDCDDHLSMSDLFRLYIVFDDAISEVIRLLETDAYVRFKMSAIYRRLYALVFPEEVKQAKKNLLSMLDTEENANDSKPSLFDRFFGGNKLNDAINVPNQSVTNMSKSGSLQIPGSIIGGSFTVNTTIFRRNISGTGTDVGRSLHMRRQSDDNLAQVKPGPPQPMNHLFGDGNIPTAIDGRGVSIASNSISPDAKRIQILSRPPPTAHTPTDDSSHTPEPGQIVIMMNYNQETTVNGVSTSVGKLKSPEPTFSPSPGIFQSPSLTSQPLVVAATTTSVRLPHPVPLELPEHATVSE